MLTRAEDVEAHALRKRGWTVSAIARHLGRDRKTVRGYLDGKRKPGERRPAGPDAFGRFAEYCRIRLADDPHLCATVLFEEVTALGFGGGYSSFTRALRAGGLRPGCEACAAAGRVRRLGRQPAAGTRRPLPVLDEPRLDRPRPPGRHRRRPAVHHRSGEHGREGGGRGHDGGLRRLPVLG